MTHHDPPDVEKTYNFVLCAGVLFLQENIDWHANREIQCPVRLGLCRRVVSRWSFSPLLMPPRQPILTERTAAMSAARTRLAWRNVDRSVPMMTVRIRLIFDDSVEKQLTFLSISIALQSFSECIALTTRTAPCVSRSVPQPKRSSWTLPTSWVCVTRSWPWQKSNQMVRFFYLLSFALAVYLYTCDLLYVGEKTVFNDTEVSIATSLTINGRIFVSPKDHLDAMVTNGNGKSIKVDLLASCIYNLISCRRCCPTKKDHQKGHVMNWKCLVRGNLHTI